jgi:AcrR family transcriptional regulator
LAIRGQVRGDLRSAALLELKDSSAEVRRYPVPAFCTRERIICLAQDHFRSGALFSISVDNRREVRLFIRAGRVFSGRGSVPKVVDHDERRLELLDATWRIIARHGMERATMREIATEAGFANGALKPYFPTKEMLLEFAFGHVFNRTNKRINKETTGLSGLSALRSFCLEVLPLDEERINEARIVVAFWQKAVNDRKKARIHQECMGVWLITIRRCLNEAREMGDVSTTVDDSVLAVQLLNMLLGAQIEAALSQATEGRPEHAQQLEGYLALLHPDMSRS